MSINPYNYETFFWLYTDGELSAAEKKSVEQFVLNHPAYAAELEMCKQSRLPFETIPFPDKTVLLRNESTEINLTNYESYFLLYVDNELGSSEKNLVETFVLQNPNLQESFTLLKQTRLTPEKIIFPNKASLHRNVATKKPVYLPVWSRLAIAAAFTALLLMVWFTTLKNNTPEKNLAGINKPDQAIEQPTKSVLDHRSENGKAASVKIHLQHAEPVFKSRQTLTQQVFQKKVFAEAAEPVPVNPVISETEKLTVNTEVPVSKSLQLQSLPEATPLPAGNDPVSVKPPVADNIPVPDFTRQVVYKELDTDDDRKSLYLGSLEINKDKLRGLFRKAGNFFRSKTRQLPEEEISEVNRASSSRTLK